MEPLEPTPSEPRETAPDRPLRAEPPAPDVLVVGAGVIGLAIARELAAFGDGELIVEVVDRGEHRSAASWASAGMLAPLAEVPRPGPLFDACRTSRDLWPAWLEELAEETGDAVELDRSGALLVELPGDDPEALDRLAAACRELGEEAEAIDGAQLRVWVPDLPADVSRGLLLPGELRVDNRALLDALEAACTLRGVRLTAPRTVETVSRHGNGVRVEGPDFLRDAGVVVVATGAWTGLLESPDLAELVELPVHPVRGQMLKVSGVDWPWTGIVRRGDLYAVRRGGDDLLVGATIEEAGFDAATTVDGLGWLLEGLGRMLPGLGSAAVTETWAGLRPATADGLPILGPLPSFPSVVVATGHYRNGILLAPWTAAGITEAVVEGMAPDPLAPFAPGRFDPN